MADKVEETAEKLVEQAETTTADMSSSNSNSTSSSHEEEVDTSSSAKSEAVGNRAEKLIHLAETEHTASESAESAASRIIHHLTSHGSISSDLPTFLLEEGGFIHFQTSATAASHTMEQTHHGLDVRHNFFFSADLHFRYVITTVRLSGKDVETCRGKYSIEGEEIIMTSSAHMIEKVIKGVDADFKEESCTHHYTATPIRKDGRLTEIEIKNLGPCQPFSAIPFLHAH